MHWATERLSSEGESCLCPEKSSVVHCREGERELALPLSFPDFFLQTLEKDWRSTGKDT